MSKIIQALRRRFKTPSEVMERLGLDARDLADVVGDSTKELRMAKTKMSLMAAAAHGAVSVYLKPKLAADKKLPDLVPLFAGIATKKDFGKQKGKLASDIKLKIKPILAKDADANGLVKLLDALEEVAPDALEPGLEPGIPGEPVHTEGEDDEEDLDSHHKALDAEEINNFLKEKGMSDDDCKTVMDMISAAGGANATEATHDDDPGEIREKEGLDQSPKDMPGVKMEGGTAKDEPLPFKGKPEVGGKMAGDKMVSKKAMDEAIAAAVDKTKKELKLANDAAIKTATDAANKRAKEIRDAENDVRPWVGTLGMAHDSAEEVYKTALGALGIDVAGVHPSAFKVILHREPKPGERKTVATDESLAMDGAAVDDFAKRHPEAAAIDII